MNWEAIITLLIKAAAIAVAGVYLVYIKPWLSAKISALNEERNNSAWLNILTTIGEYVRAAEQKAMNGGYDGEWKKQFVINALEDAGINVTAEIDNYIEAAVITFHNEIYNK